MNNPVIKLENAEVFQGHNLDVLKTFADNSVDSIVTDPPYELGFMNKSWDASGIAYNVELWRECLRVLKPGGHLLAFSGSRTYHRMVVAIEDAGFEIRDMIAWISNKTFPKSHNIQKSTKKINWAGWGTALKPTVEPIVMARKPIEGTIAENVLAWGVGGLNIHASRIGTESVTINTFDNGAKPFGDAIGEPYTSRQSIGRWPANIILDEDTAKLLDKQSGDKVRGNAGSKQITNFTFGSTQEKQKLIQGVTDIGGASRFFYVARANKQDRNEGQVSNTHPTVKPTTLMSYLIKLVTPVGATVLDPFAGSGSTGKAALLEGYKFIGIELTAEYLPIIEGRLKHAETTCNNKQETLFDD